MTDPEHTTDSLPEDEPIDAAFEPATPVDAPSPKRDKSGGPGWMGAGLLSLMAAGLGGAIGLFGGQVLPNTTMGSGGSPELSRQIETLAKAQSDMETAIAKAARDTKELETSLSQRLANIANAEDNQALAEMLTELDAVSKRLDEALASTAGGEAFEQLASRVAALETVDTSGEASPKDINRAVAGLNERIGVIEADLSALKDLTADPADGASASVTADIDSLQGQVSDLATQVADMSRTVDAMQQTIEENQTAAEDAEAGIALNAISSAASRGEPFEDAYQSLRAAMPESADVRQLASAAGNPPPTVQALRASFSDLEARALAADAKPTDSGALGWINKTFGDAVNVTPAEPDETSTQTILTRASDALAEGDLGTTLATLGQLDSNVRGVFADWTDKAQSRLALERTLANLQQAGLEGEFGKP